MVVMSLLAPAAVAVGGIPGEGAGERQVACKFTPANGKAHVRIRDEIYRPRFPGGLPPELRDEIEPSDLVFREPGIATVQRRAQGIAVIEGFDGILDHGETSAPIPCTNGPLTVDNADHVQVDLGKHSDMALLFVDLAYGLFEPGATDEGDAGSEIEMAADLGFGFALVRGRREADQMTIGHGTRTKVNVDAAESVDDSDLSLNRYASVALYGAGGNDELSVPINTISVVGEDDPMTVSVAGGQGEDRLQGADGTDFLSGGPGADRVNSGRGIDLIVAVERAPDRIDCGPGHDVVLSRTKHSNRLRGCERVLTLAELSIEAEVVEEVAVAPIASRRLTRVMRPVNSIARLRKLAVALRRPSVRAAIAALAR